MNQNAVIAGSFADLKTVKSRSVLQMIVEVPIEHGERLVAMFGFPQPGEEVPVAVARLLPAAAPEPPAAEKPKRSWDELTHAQQAGMLCAEVGFQRWIKVEGADAAAGFVRDHCGVKSRRELDQDEDAASRWNRLAGQYRDFQRYGDLR